MNQVNSLSKQRYRQEEKVLNKVNNMFSCSLLREATALVRKHFPDTKIRDAWTYHFHSGHWEFHGPDGFYWHGNAENAYDARYHGWMAWLKTKGIFESEGVT